MLAIKSQQDQDVLKGINKTLRNIKGENENVIESVQRDY